MVSSGLEGLLVAYHYHQPVSASVNCSFVGAAAGRVDVTVLCVGLFGVNV